MEPLVALMQETPADRLLPAVVERMKGGTDLRQMVAAAALANARTFGGQDYDGYHAIMALAPAYAMSRELPEAQAALPVLKVLYRNTNHIQQKGGPSHEALHVLETTSPSAGESGAEALREATRRQDIDGGGADLRRAGAGSARRGVQRPPVPRPGQRQRPPGRPRLALLGAARLHRQGTRPHPAPPVGAVLRRRGEQLRDKNGGEALRALLPKLLERDGLASRSPGDRQPGDDWIERMSQTIYAARREQAAEAVAEALREGVAPEAVGEAISLAANQLVLHDPGRRKEEGAGKPIGSVHGASVGVHASDAANAWRNIARVSDRRNVVASLIVGAYHTAGQSGGLNPQPYPFAEHREKVVSVEPTALLPEADTAIRAGDQARACALVHRYGELGLPARPVFDLLLGYAISEDGALHAEKYYRTVTEEFAATRPAFRWRQLAALARVTASEYGRPAPGIAEARRLIGV